MKVGGFEVGEAMSAPRFPGGLTIRRRILLFQVAIGLAVLSLFVAGLAAIRNFNYHLERGALAHEQLDLLTGLQRAATQYSEQLAGHLAAGLSEPAEIARLHSELATGFGALESATRRERDFLLRHEAVSADEAELTRASRMRQLYDDMNRAFEALAAMSGAGQGEAALQVYFRNVDGGLNSALENLLAEAVADELAEIEAADTEARAAARTLGWLIAATAAAVLAAAAFAGYFLYRSVANPIQRLTAGALAIGAGDLSYRVGKLGDDELGLLAARFDEMADELKEQQRLLLAAHSDLESQVKARTAELQDANERLKRLDRSRVRFLADISHELRTPLTIMRGEAEVTLRGKHADIAGHRETLKQIVEQATEMGRLVDDLMLLARSETDDIRFEREALNLSEIATEAVREARVLGQGRGVAIRGELDALPLIEGDRKRTKQLLMIVLDNAVKYSPRDAEVVIDGQVESDSVTLTVRNSSAVLDETEVPHVFERFHRGREATTENSTGSGLGLAIARWIAEKQGGAISLARTGTEGVEVVVTFPRHAAPGLPRDTAQREAAE